VVLGLEDVSAGCYCYCYFIPVRLLVDARRLPSADARASCGACAVAAFACGWGCPLLGARDKGWWPAPPAGADIREGQAAAVVSVV
jgi:hypothetical protein